MNQHTTRHIRVGDIDHAYREAGAGPPIVLVHGILSDSRFWQPQLDGLGDDVRVVAWDVPGTGESDDPDEFVDITWYVDALGEFLDAIDATPATLVGLSWGGILVLEFFRRHPSTVAAMVLTDTYAGWRGSLPRDEYRARRDGVLRFLGDAPSDAVPDEIPGVIHPDAPPEVHRRVHSLIDDAHPIGFRAMARASMDVDASDVLPTIDVPTLLVWGSEDDRSPLAVARSFHDAIPGSRLVTIPGAGHVSSLERPDEFNEAVRGFLGEMTEAGAG